jgi:hypothetical protein
MTWAQRWLEEGRCGAHLIAQAPPKKPGRVKLRNVPGEDETPRAKTVLPRMMAEEIAEKRARGKRLAARGLPVPRIAEALCLSEAATRAILGAA